MVAAGPGPTTLRRIMRDILGLDRRLISEARRTDVRSTRRLEDLLPPGGQPLLRQVHQRVVVEVRVELVQAPEGEVSLHQELHRACVVVLDVVHTQGVPGFDSLSRLITRHS